MSPIRSAQRQGAESRHHRPNHLRNPHGAVEELARQSVIRNLRPSLKRKRSQARKRNGVLSSRKARRFHSTSSRKLGSPPFSRAGFGGGRGWADENQRASSCGFCCEGSGFLRPNGPETVKPRGRAQCRPGSRRRERPKIHPGRRRALPWALLFPAFQASMQGGFQTVTMMLRGPRHSHRKFAMVFTSPASPASLIRNFGGEAKIHFPLSRLFDSPAFGPEDEPCSFPFSQPNAIGRTDRKTTMTTTFSI